MTPDDEPFLRRAIELAAAGRAAGDAPFGSLLVGPDGDVLVEDYNTVLSDNDISAQFAALRASGGFPPVPQEGPALFDEARIPIDGYYH